MFRTHTRRFELGLCSVLIWGGLLLMASTSHAADTVLKPASANPEKWEPVYADEFDGTEISKEHWKWINKGDGFGNKELEFYTDRPENSFIKDGCLVLKAIKEPYKNCEYTSAKLLSKDAWTYGRFEIRAKLPSGKGIWPAFWMMPSDNKIYGGWPSCGEIDIMEQLGHDPNKIYGTLHFGNPHKSHGKNILSKKPLAEDFHEYVIEWYPGEFRWYLDGELFHVCNDWFTNAKDAVWPAPFNRDFYMQLNLAVGGNWPGSPDATTQFPQEMYIDYIRVYKCKGEEKLREKGTVDSKLPGETKK